MNPQPSGGLIHAAVKDLAAETGGPPVAVIQRGDDTGLRKAKGNMYHATECDVGQLWVRSQRMPCRGEWQCPWVGSQHLPIMPPSLDHLSQGVSSPCCSPPPCESISGKATDRGWVI